MMADLLLSGGTIVTVDPARSVIEDGAIAITDNRIIAVGPRGYVTRAHPAKRVIDTSHHAILPGLIDSHGHAGHGLVKSLCGGDGAAWMDACRRIYTQASSPAFWRAEARLSALERLMFGVTTGVSLLGGGDSVMRSDDPSHGIAHAEGAADIGIRDIMAVGPTRPPHPRLYASWEGGRRMEYPVSFERQLETMQALIETCHCAHTGRGLGQVAMLMPVVHSLPSDTAERAAIQRQGRLVRELQARYRLLFHQDGHHKGSIELADKVFGLVGPDSFLSHCTDLTQGDFASLERQSAAVVHNPSALASVRGYCPVPALLERGITVMLGSDGTAPDRSSDMFRHMFQCMRLHQREARDENLIPPGKALEMVTIDAARGLRMEREIGSLEPGKRADIITVDLRKPHLAPRHMPLWRLVCFANGQDVDTVIVDGNVLMQGRIVPHVDIGTMLDEAQIAAELMLDRAGLRAAIAEPTTLWGQTRSRTLRAPPGVRPPPR
jgi:5-methylthioadenosine/S-adenosylhomocysteine deaminase